MPKYAITRRDTFEYTIEVEAHDESTARFEAFAAKPKNIHQDMSPGDRFSTVLGDVSEATA